MVRFDRGERVSAAWLVELLEPRGWNGGGGEVGRALCLVLADFFHEECLARLAKLHVDVQWLAVQL